MVTFNILVTIFAGLFTWCLYKDGLDLDGLLDNMFGNTNDIDYWIETLQFHNDMYTDDGIRYTYDDSETYVIITGFNNEVSSFEIPDEIDGKPVKEISRIGSNSYNNIQEIVISSEVNYIEDNAFVGCEYLERILVDEDNDYYSSVDGVLYNKDKTKLYIYPNGKEDEEFSIPDGVIEIYAYAFYESDLKEIVMPDIVELIGEWAFCECDKLKHIDLSDSLAKIGSDSFDYCSSLKSITLPKSLETIEDSSFSETGLEDVYYKGTMKQWNPINIEDSNFALDDVITTDIWLYRLKDIIVGLIIVLIVFFIDFMLIKSSINFFKKYLNEND